jgi:hypothetical protein
MMYPEMNIKKIYKWFCNRGYKGYLLYGVNAITGKFNPMPGFTSLRASKQDMFTEAKFQIQHNSGRERHLSLVFEWRDIKGVEDLTNHDLFCAWGAARLGSRARAPHIQVMKNQTDTQKTVRAEEIWGEAYSY